MELKEFTQEEVTQLKEFAENMGAISRTARIGKTILLWCSGGIVSYLVIWEHLLKSIFWKG